MKLVWSIVSALLFLQISSGNRLCKIWSSAGLYVQWNSTFKVYCTFLNECSPSMYSGDSPRPQSHRVHNSTTIYLDVKNLMEERATFSCDCDETSVNTDNKLDSCGLDISAGYPPDVPTNMSCTYKVGLSMKGRMICSWNSGRKTYLRNSSTLRVKTFTHNASEGSQQFTVSERGSASFVVDRSVHIVSFWVRVSNRLGSAESPVINYNLSDIMMPDPPDLDEVGCTSRNCTISITQTVPTLHLAVYYKEEDGERWTLHPDSVMSNGLFLVESLQPFRRYQFRARSRFRTGLWSSWSRNVSRWTQEEAPAVALDVWYAIDHSEKSMRVFWKQLDPLFAQGKILKYIITVSKQNSTQTSNVSFSKRNHSVAFCPNCEVTVSACNSKGRSPPARITVHTTLDMPPLEPEVNSQNVTLYWRKRGTAALPLDTVVEWYPRGQRLDELRWVRTGPNSRRVVITDMKPFTCYEGAVYVIYSNKSMGRHVFTGVNTLVSVPTKGPVVQEMEEGSTVNVTWSELPERESGGCITKYTIYLESSSGTVTAYNASASQRFWVLRGLTPAVYSVWMTASTAKGEGRKGDKVKFYIRPDSQVPLIITLGTVIILGGVVLFCAWQISAVKERFWVYFQFCRPEEIPDPANSKWARDCLLEKGKVTLQVQLSTSTASEEEELVLVDVLELPRPLLCPQSSLNSDSEPSTPLYPHTAYIKSLSHDSYSSGDTQTSSLDTNETVDYISSHETTAMSEEEDLEDVSGFFPSHSFAMDPVNFGPKLTLDAVRIDGNEFFLQCD